MRIRMAIILSWFASFLLFISIPYDHSDKELDVYYDEFTLIANNYCNKVHKPNQFKMSFGVLSGDIIGACTTYSFKKEIVIDKFYWSYANAIEKKQLMFHELTHCLLNKTHDETKGNYMNSYPGEITEEELYNQVTENIKVFCSGG